MSELMVDFIMSLDGYGAAEGWPGLWGKQGPEYLSWMEEDEAADHATLMGANTYREMAGYAANMPDDPGLAALTKKDKIVFSSTLEGEPEWANTRVVGGDAVAAVEEMKGEARPLRTLGSVSLCRSLIEAGLVDLYRVVVFPVVNGATGHARLFDGYPDLDLELVDHRTFDGRLQLLEYVPTVLDAPPAAG